MQLFYQYNRWVGFIKKHPFFFLLFLGLLIRLSLIFLDYSFDVNNHIVWAKDLIKRGFAGFYEKQSSEVYGTIHPNYPPMSLLIFYIFYPLQKIVHSIVWWLNLNVSVFPSNTIFFIEKKLFLAGMLKLPAIFADLGVAYVVYLFAKKINPKNKKLHLIASSFVLFNPAFIFNSALWGQIDAIPIFFVLLAAYWLYYKNSYLLSGIWFVIALLIKPTALVFLPLFMVLFYQKFGWKKSLTALVINNLIFWLSFLPFFRNGNVLTFPYTTYLKGILQTQSLPFVTNGAFNFWVLITQFKGINDTAAFLLGIQYRYWGYLIVGLLNLLIIRNVLKSKDKVSPVLFGLFLASFSALLFLTKMHERYSLLPLAFLLLATLTDKKNLRWFYILSLASFLNHYHSWPVPKIEAFLTVLRNPIIYTSISLFNVLLFLYLFKKFTTSKI